MSTPAKDISTAAYTTLTEVFRKYEDQVLEIEILPPALAPRGSHVLEDGLCIGIPKRVLVQAYLTARALFFVHSKSDHQSIIALEATKVILLFDPEHITAANFRKRQLVRFTSTQSTIPTDATYVVQREVKFLNSILTSPLHRQSKSPTLWHHRFWLFSKFIYSATSVIDESNAVLEEELESVLKAAERHPKNYYAWQYARRLIERIFDLVPGNEPHQGTHKALDCAKERVKTWCLKHPSDISGWSFLLWLLRHVEALQSRQVVQDLIRVVVSFRMKQESIWVFIRTILADDLLGNDREVFIRGLGRYEKLRPYTAPFDEPLRVTGQDQEKSTSKIAIDWIHVYKKTLP